MTPTTISNRNPTPSALLPDHAYSCTQNTPYTRIHYTTPTRENECFAETEKETCRVVVVVADYDNGRTTKLLQE